MQRIAVLRPLCSSGFLFRLDYLWFFFFTFLFCFFSNHDIWPVSWKGLFLTVFLTWIGYQTLILNESETMNCSKEMKVKMIDSLETSSIPFRLHWNRLNKHMTVYLPALHLCICNDIHPTTTTHPKKKQKIKVKQQQK